MTIAIRDENRIPTMIALSSANGVDIVPIKVNPVSHSTVVDAGGAGVDYSEDVASRDENYIPVAMGVSALDGVTPTAIYASPEGALLIHSI